MILLTACAGGDAAAGDAAAAGLATSFDSTGDTVFARVSGEVPASALRRLVPELWIAPAADDTSLFTEVFEFDVDRAGRLWVYDGPTNSIFLFGPGGDLIRRIGRQGGGPGEFNANNGMVALPDTGLAIWDSRNARITFFDAAGALRGSWPTPTGFSTNDGLVTDRSGALYLHQPVTPPREGEILGRMGLVGLDEGGVVGDSLVPPDLPVQREVYVAVRRERGGESRSSTSSGHAPGYHWAWHPDGHFVVAHGGQYEIVLARPAGKPLVIRRELPPVPVPDEELEEQRAWITYSLRLTDPSWSWSGPLLPRTKAPMTRLFVARDGRLWVRVAAPSERIPDAELMVPRGPRVPVSHYRTPAVYEVFAQDGRFLGRVEFPPRTTLMEADGDLVWALARDEDGLPAVARFRVEPGLR